MKSDRSHRTTLKLSCVLSGIFAVAFFLAAPVSGQGNEGEQPKHSLRPGAWALEFEVQPSLSGYYSAAGIAAKRHFSAHSALRFGFLTAINHSDGDGTRAIDFTSPYDTVQGVSDLENDSDRRDVSAFLHFLQFVGMENHFGLFLEAGPTARWTSEEYAYLSSYPDPQQTSRQIYDRDSWSYGLDVAGGFEWFFTRRLSLAGRYGISALLTDTDQTASYEYYNPTNGYSDRRLDVTHSDGLNVQTTPAVISLTAYF